MTEQVNNISLTCNDGAEKRPAFTSEYSTFPATSGSMAEPTTRTYHLRWMYLLISVFIQIGAMQAFIGFAPVANIVDSYYGSGTHDTLDLIFIGVTIPCYVICILLSPTIGLRWLILGCLALTALGNGVRGLSVIDGPSVELKKWILYVGHGIAAVGGPVPMFLPTKVSSAWFPPSQRAISTSINSISSPFGILLINLIVPRIIKKNSDLMELNIIHFALPFASLILAIFTIHRNAPVIPPSLSAADGLNLPLKESLLTCVKSRAYVVLAICAGGGIALFNVLFTLMEKILCIRGYDNDFSGLVTALMIASGLVGATLAGLFVDRTKLFVETLKVALPLACFCGICFSIAAHYPNIELLILASVILFGFFGLAFYGIAIEMTAECTYPVSELTSAGLLGLIGQIESFIILLILGWLTKPATNSDLIHQVCTKNPKEIKDLEDYNYPLIAIAVIGTAVVVFFVPFFRPEYKRMRMEHRRASQDTTPTNVRF
uniref:Major facilitator superfamily (MFS) profile domain-containing protein n=1 Tax=Plectus sambesii TaxID=2011161 RepID=A0A914WKL6_9BILA